MTLRFSPALQNFIAEGGSWKDAFDQGSLEIYTGAQPATPDLAVTGTLLATITSNAGTKTNETKATGIVTLTGTTSGSVDTLTLAGIDLIDVPGQGTVAYTVSLNATATAVATRINRNPANKLVVASTTGASAIITLTARPGLGVALNGLTIATTSTGLTSTATSNMGQSTGVVGIAAANGLRMDYNAVAGVMTKDPTQTWSGTAVGAGTQTAGWFRYKGGIVDAGSLDSGAVYLRMDGSIATSGADMNMNSTSVTNGALQTVSTFSFTVPAA